MAIEKGKTLIIKLVAVSPVNTETGIRDILFELVSFSWTCMCVAISYLTQLFDTQNGELRAVQVEDKNAAIEQVRREKATSDPGSIGSPMSAVVVEVRVHEGQEIKAGDP